MDKSKAKRNVLGSLSKEMRGMMGEKYGEGLKDKMMKVSVAGDNPEAVEEGLDTAKEILSKKVGPMAEESDEMVGIPESLDEELSEESMELNSPEEIKAMIEELQQKLAMLEASEQIEE